LQDVESIAARCCSPFLLTDGLQAGLKMLGEGEELWHGILEEDIKKQLDLRKGR
jgi:hypothetical protein